MNTIKVEHPNGYTGVLYGEKSMSIFDKDGKEVMHTGFRNTNTADDLYKLLEGYPSFIESIRKDMETPSKPLMRGI